ncbi:hypothetical protein [Arundinibacter roseus]|uniref:Uncharacterized protein n=1 Tax=Arundinibacter roseus TaxID=2070510 RepID=A0A4R4K8U1_9BACT|nr:hypothetical protein [Arundinibacter roseus]TDB64154.1 hypothetical protein EZE20_14540 [Arundinibacter roseus]
MLFSILRWLIFPFLFLGLSLHQTCFGQGAITPDPAKQWYDRETIYLLSPNRYVRNNMVYAGGNQLRREFMISPGGMQLYVRSRRTRSIALVFSLAGSAGTIYTLVSGNRDAFRTFFWVSLGTGLASGALNSRANAQLNQAVWLRNRDAMIFSESQK